MKKIILSISIMSTCAFFSPAHSNDSLYYQIGGGKANDDTFRNFNSFTLNLDPYVGGNYTCGNFDITESVNQLVSELSSVPDEFAEYLQVAALDLLLGLAAVSLQKAAPGIYEFLTNSYARHKEYVEVRLASCRELERTIDSGEINGFRDLAKLVSWRRSAETDTSIQEAEEEATGEAGVPWINGNAGGVGQEPIKIVADSITAGYSNMFGSGGPDASSGFAGTQFSTADEASAWAVKVLGEKFITFVDDSSTESGGGLLSVVAPEAEEVLTVINDIIDNPVAATPDQLDLLSTPFYRITPTVLETINSNNSTSRNILINRLASEISIYRNIERAFFIRSVLRSSLDHSAISFHNEAPRMVREMIAELDDDIMTIRARNDIRKEFVGNLLQYSIENAQNIESSADLAVPQGRARETLPDGSIIKEQ